MVARDGPWFLTIRLTDGGSPDRTIVGTPEALAANASSISGHAHLFQWNVVVDLDDPDNEFRRNLAVRVPLAEAESTEIRCKVRALVGEPTAEVIAGNVVTYVFVLRRHVSRALKASMTDWLCERLGFGATGTIEMPLPGSYHRRDGSWDSVRAGISTAVHPLRCFGVTRLLAAGETPTATKRTRMPQPFRQNACACFEPNPFWSTTMDP